MHLFSLLLCLFLLLLQSIAISSNAAIHLQDFRSKKPMAKEKRCECGRYTRDQRANATKIVAGKRYDTLVPLNKGLDANVEHAYSVALGKCVAIKHCVEQTDRLNKCTRELEVLKTLSNKSGRENPHLVKLLDYEMVQNQTCQESSTFSDYLRMIVIGSNRRRRNTYDEQKSAAYNDAVIATDSGMDNASPKNICTEVITVLELGQGSVMNLVEQQQSKDRNVATNTTMFALQVRTQIQKALDGMHGRGLAHRDVHQDNVLIFPLPKQQSGGMLPFLVKLIDFGWTCCFDVTKCGHHLADVLPHCDPADALPDDQFGLNDLIHDLEKSTKH